MARKFACIMAAIGMNVVLVRAALQGGSFEGTIISALFWMMLLGTVGLLVGAIAQSTVDESVRQRMHEELAARSSRT